MYLNKKLHYGLFVKGKGFVLVHFKGEGKRNHFFIIYIIYLYFIL